MIVQWTYRERVEARAIEDAYATHIGKLTTVLCEEIAGVPASEFENVISRFRAGILAARAAYDAATKAFEEISS